jgi:hypothetical protein
MIPDTMSGKLHTSANSMETSGAVRIFERSLATRGLKYKDMLGDGDSSTYRSVGHIQKRVGSRLRKMKNTKKGAKLSDGKGLSAKGRLTDGKIDILQNYYGLAVRENLNDIDEMANAIKTSLYHVASTEENPQHHLCPDG